MSEAANEIDQEEEDRTKRLQAIVNHNTSTHVLMGLTDQDVMMVCLQEAFNACLHGFSINQNDEERDLKTAAVLAADHLEGTCKTMMRAVRHKNATQLILPH